MATKRKSTKRKATTKRKVGAVRTTKRAYSSPKRRSSSRSKVGALSSTTEILLGAVAGSFVTRVVQANLPAPKTSTSMDLRPYTGLILGAGAEFFGKKNLLVRSMGIGAIVEGARSIIADKYIPNLTGSKTAGLPYTTAHVGKNKMRKLMGIRNGLAGSPRALAATSTPMGLAGISPNASFYGGYDGM